MQKFIELSGAFGWYRARVNYIRVGVFLSHGSIAMFNQIVWGFIGKKKVKKKRKHKQGFLLCCS